MTPSPQKGALMPDEAAEPREMLNTNPGDDSCAEDTDEAGGNGMGGRNAWLDTEGRSHT